MAVRKGFIAERARRALAEIGLGRGFSAGLTDHGIYSVSATVQSPNANMAFSFRSSVD